MVVVVWPAGKVPFRLVSQFPILFMHLLLQICSQALSLLGEPSTEREDSRLAVVVVVVVVVPVTGVAGSE